MKTEKFPPGKLIFMEGDPGDEAYRVLGGSVEISIQEFGGMKHAVTVAIEADSEEMRKQGALQGRVIRQFPFQFGRRGEFAGADTPTLNQLLLADRAPYRVSRKHCILDANADGVFVEDRNSRLGTVVNGVRIGGGSREHRARLRDGENSLVLGGADSQVRFKLILNLISSFG